MSATSQPTAADLAAFLTQIAAAKQTVADADAALATAQAASLAAHAALNVLIANARNAFNVMVM